MLTVCREKLSLLFLLIFPVYKWSVEICINLNLCSIDNSLNNFGSLALILKQFSENFSHLLTSVIAIQFITYLNLYFLNKLFIFLKFLKSTL